MLVLCEFVFIRFNLFEFFEVVQLASSCVKFLEVLFGLRELRGMV